MLAYCKIFIVVAVLCLNIDFSKSKYVDLDVGYELYYGSHIPKYPNEFPTEGKYYLY